MLKQRLLTHFRPRLIAVSKAGALIVAYQLFDQIRTRLQHPPLNISDVLMAASVALFALALFCVAWACGEWCWFKLRGVRRFWRDLRKTLNDQRRTGTVRTA